MPIVVREIERQLAKGRRVLVIAHSQGGIILSNVVHRLVEKARTSSNALQSLRRLETYTFCSAADEFHGAADPSGTSAVVPFAEHFATRYDFIARIGVLEASGVLSDCKRSWGTRERSKALERETEPWNGAVHVLNGPGQGHFLKEMVFPSMFAGEFGQQSQLWCRYFDKTSSKYTSVSHHILEKTSENS